ncbi:MAG: peptidoglycan editing factor PgeF [Henriciella sp.]|nr:peptidoglycan editing factor PgeF [Henriciella sp.]
MSTLKGIRHGFFGRRGGVSSGLYDSLNIGEGSGDEASHISANRDRVKQVMTADHLISCYQVHSPTVVRVTEPFLERPEADAMVTTHPGLALCILTADCVPVLFADAEAGIIGAAHAGWKGALSGVVEATLQAMENLGAQRNKLTAAIGPAIQQASYEVGPEFRDTWVGTQEWTDRLFVAGEGDRSHFDLTGYIHHVLQREGIGAIDALSHDTCTMDSHYFSNRRRNHRGEPDYGRNGSVIVLSHEG